MESILWANNDNQAEEAGWSAMRLPDWSPENSGEIPQHAATVLTREVSTPELLIVCSVIPFWEGCAYA